MSSDVIIMNQSRWINHGSVPVEPLIVRALPVKPIPVKVATSRRKKVKRLQGPEIGETNVRVLKLIEAAEEGRKRATTLPPLERELTFHRKPKNYNAHAQEGNRDEARDSHWNKKYEKVSIEVDSRIKTHLKKQMLHRFEKRLRKMDEEYSDDGSIRHGKDHTRHGGKNDKHAKKGHGETRDIFSKYTDTGGKADGTHHAPASRDRGLPNIPPPKDVQNASAEQRNPKVQLPNIDQSADEHPIVNGDLDLPIDRSDSALDDDDVQLNGDLSESDREVFKLTSVGAQLPEDFRKMNISPIQTPVVFRPMTREQTMLNYGERNRRILQGQVHRACPRRNKIIRLYISSGFIDSEAERTLLREKVYPRLRTLCAMHERHLEIVDCHWGLKDASADDHSIPDVCISNMEKCLKDDLQSVNLLVLLTDRYGPALLPSKIPVDEYESIREAITAYRKAQIEIIQSKITDAILPRTDTALGRLRVADNEAGRHSVAVSDISVSVVPNERTDVSKSASTLSSHHDQSEEDKESHAAMPISTSVKKEVDNKRQQELIRMLKEREGRLPDPDLLDTWYGLDENACPPVYQLHNISSIMPEFGKGDAAKREHARFLWHETQTKLTKMLQEFGKQTISDPFALKKYFTPLLELELGHGLLERDLHTQQCVVVKRAISNIQQCLDEDLADEYADVTIAKPRRLNRENRDKLEKLRKHLIPQKVSDKFVLSFEIRWASGGVRLSGDRAHVMYLDWMSKQIGDVLYRKLLEQLREEADQHNENTALFEEVSEHVIFCQERSGQFQGRRDTLQMMKAYLRSGCPTVLVVHGQAGCGKSALLAKAAKTCHKWLRCNDSIPVVFRSVGATKDSRNVRNLLHNICLQLCIIFGNDRTEVPTDYTGLVNDFSQRICQATEDMPLVVFIDSLNNLSDAHHGRRLTWLPKTLPAHVHIVVSTLPDEQFECLTSLKQLLDNNEDVFLEIPELPEDDAIAILEHWYNSHNRTVTSDQYELILGAFNKCPSPLFLKLLFKESLQWTSSIKLSPSKLGVNVTKMATIQFGQVEMKLGETFVRRALGYITASRSGLTDSEMLDILSLDDAVMAEVIPRFQPIRRRVPPMLWYRLKHELREYLTESNADNVQTIQWAYSHFHDAATDRYLNQRDKAPSYHKTLSEYFLSEWVDQPKPYPGNDKGALRYVSDQPLYWEPEEAKHDCSDRIYNLRKINELPYHLLNSQQTKLYKSETMCNFEWVLAKLCGTSLRSLVEEYHTGLEVEPSDHDLKALSDTLQLSATAVLRDPRQLAGQVVGRVQGIINRDIPATPGDPPKYPYLHTFLAQAKNTSIPALVPSIGCLTEPGGILFDLLSGHLKAITAVTVTTDASRALTASEDNTMNVWDLKNGKVMATIDHFGTNVTKLRSVYNNQYVVSVEGSVIRFWYMRTKVCELVVDQYLDPPLLSVAAEGKLLVAVFDGANMLRTWDMERNLTFICEAPTGDSKIYSDNTGVLAAGSFTDYVLHAFRGGNSATIQHARTGKIAHILKCHDSSSSVVALAITRDYMVVACRQQYMKLHEIHQLELFDAKKGKYLRSIRGCTQDIITELHINLVCSHAISVCTSETTNASNIMIWNLETEDHKHLARHAGVTAVSACADFRYCLTAKKGDNTLKVWNLSKNINTPMPKLKKSLGVAEIYPMIDNPRYAIARQVNHGPVSIWNVAKAKCLTHAVRIERGLSETSDIVLIRNTTVFILTEKGLKDSRPVFKTVLVYDLRQKKYVKKLHPCFIVPSPSHEYVLLDDTRLLGPADTRNHFIIWSLETGKELYRIRPQMEDFDTKHMIKDADIERSVQLRATTAKLTPWERRSESPMTKKRRRAREREEARNILEELHKEKQNGIEQFIISGDRNVIVTSYFAHHMLVFNVGTMLHTQTIENPHSMLFLHVSALNYDGSHLVHANYDEFAKTSYITIWDTETGQVKKRLKNEMDVLAIAITDDASRVVFGKSNQELRIWDPKRSGPNSMKKIKGYDSLEFDVNSKIFILNKGKRAVVFAGDISLWDLEKATLLAVFTPDTRIEVVSVVMSGQLITFGVHEFPDLVILKMTGKDIKPITEDEHEDLFGETTGDTSDEDEDDDEDDAVDV